MGYDYATQFRILITEDINFHGPTQKLCQVIVAEALDLYKNILVPYWVRAEVYLAQHPIPQSDREVTVVKGKTHILCRIYPD